MANHVFISYSHKDQAFVNRLIEELRKLGVEIWINDNNRDANDISKNVMRAIREAIVFILVVSPNSTESSRVFEEFRIASSFKKQILPVIIGETKIPDIRKPRNMLTFWDGLQALSLGLSAFVSVSSGANYISLRTMPNLASKRILRSLEKSLVALKETEQNLQDDLKEQETLDQVRFAERDLIGLHLEMDPKDFTQNKVKFLDELAKLLKVSPQDIWIRDVRSGSVNVLLEMQSDAKTRLKHLLRSVGKMPEFEEFKKKYGLEEVDFESLIADTSSIFEDESEPSLTWLHLSDAHLRSDTGRQSKEAAKFAQDKVIDSFLESLPELLAAQNIEPDFVLFTGDIAYSGSNPEYKTATRFLKQVSAGFMKEPPFFFVPGNHDVTWKNIDKAIETKIRKRLTDNYAVDQHLLNNEFKLDRNNERRRLRNYNRFLTGFSSGNHPKMRKEYYYTTTINHLGISIGIAGLNSAWRSTRKSGKKDADLENLLLGEPQMKKALKELEDADLKIAILHHPPASDWFKSFDRSRQHLYLSGFDFVLRGHEHEELFERYTYLNTSETSIKVSSAALYFHDEYPNGFNAVKIYLKQGVVRIYLWTYVEKYQGWRKHLGPKLARDTGYIEFPLPEHLRERLKKALTVDPVA